MTSSSEHADRIERFKNAVYDGRRAYVPGTPEKYPGAECSVRILDAEALLAERDRVVTELDALRRGQVFLKDALAQAEAEREAAVHNAMHDANEDRARQAEAERDRLAAALLAITPEREPLDIDQDCEYCSGHFHSHEASCAWVIAREALAGVIPAPKVCVCGHSFDGSHRTPGTECAELDCDCGRFQDGVGVVRPGEPE